jgi:hypothetical protein
MIREAFTLTVLVLALYAVLTAYVIFSSPETR